MAFSDVLQTLGRVIGLFPGDNDESNYRNDSRYDDYPQGGDSYQEQPEEPSYDEPVYESGYGDSGAYGRAGARLRQPSRRASRFAEHEREQQRYEQPRQPQPARGYRQERAEQTLNDAASVVDKTSGLLSAVVSLAAITSIISTLNPLIVVLICVIIFVNSWMTKRMNAKSFALGKKLDREFRFQAFYPYALTCLEYAKEIRVFHLKSYLIGLFSDSVEKSNAIVKERRKDGRHLSLFTVITAMIQQIAVYSFCVFNVVARGLSIGTMTIYLSATGQFASALNSVFQSFLTFSYDSLAIREMIDFFNIPQKQHETGSRMPVFTKDSVIEFRHVYFRYPGNERYVIEDLNLVIRGDEKLCIVGVNGSGKSTFIKLLIRLYFPEKGEILLNGINIMEYDYEKYMRIFAPVFQDFAVYSMTLKQNIVLADAFDGSV